METRDIDRTELKGGGYLAALDGAGRHPGVIVIHEAYGLNDNIKGITRRLAGAGYVALAVDLFSDRNRSVCLARYMGGMLLGSINRYGTDDLKGGPDLPRSGSHCGRQAPRSDRVVHGWWIRDRLACTDSRLKAIAPFYAALEKALEQNHMAHDIRVYPNAHHSFFNENGTSYNQTAAEDSLARVMKFFGEQIGA
jgi:carboxymethylenebutenolidase